MKGIKVFLKKKNKKHQDARKRYRNLSEEEKEKKHQYGRERYKNILEYKKFFIISVLDWSME